VGASGVPIGILNLVFPPDRVFAENETRLLSALGDQFGGAIERARLFKEVRYLAITDSLTGLYNRRHFAALAIKELERSRRYQRSLSLAMLDIDHFKSINDIYGHLAGDQALQEVTRLCREFTRRVDLLGRFGGEEILILMPETTPLQAQAAMERLREQIENLQIDTPRGVVQITASIGITNLNAGEEIEFTPFLDRADQALYQAKNAGRNQVSVL
jgi:diguanylate cyclase (GGDEF)-like protein